MRHDHYTVTMFFYLHSWVDFVNYLEQAQPKPRAQSKVKIEAKTADSSERPTTWPTSKTSDRSKEELARGKYLAHNQEQPIWEQRKPLGVRFTFEYPPLY